MSRVALRNEPKGAARLNTGGGGDETNGAARQAWGLQSIADLTKFAMVDVLRACGGDDHVARG